MRDTLASLWNRYRAVPLIYRITVAFVLGSAAGLLFGQRMTVVRPLGDLFLRLLNMLVLPIIVVTLMTGIRQLSPTRLGRIGGATVGLYAVTFTCLFVLMGLVAGVSPVAFLAGAKDAMLTAFATRSSSGTLPVTMRNAEADLRIAERVYSFVLPVGATANMDGAAIRQAITVTFAANVVGQPLALSEQVLVLVVAVLISIGTAGVPGAGIIMRTVVLNQVGLPLEVVGFVAGVDPILGRIATLNNVTGDLAVSTVVGKWNDAVDVDSGVWSGPRDSLSSAVTSDD
jgi:Na+/H+-dicarboxylate symporter